MGIKRSMQKQLPEHLVPPLSCQAAIKVSCTNPIIYVMKESKTYRKTSSMNHKPPSLSSLKILR